MPPPLTQIRGVGPAGATRSIRLTASLASGVRGVLRALDPSLPLHSVFTLDEVHARAFWVSRLWGRMLAVVATIALLLAALGVYGVVSHNVSHRTHEIGVRMAMAQGAE